MENKPTFNRISVATLLLGLVLVDAGAAWIYHPLGLIVAGTELLILAYLSTPKDK